MLVGFLGVGKFMVFNLLMCLVDFEGGVIMLGGVVLCDYDLVVLCD